MVIQGFKTLWYTSDLNSTTAEFIPLMILQLPYKFNTIGPEVGIFCKTKVIRGIDSMG